MASRAAAGGGKVASACDVRVSTAGSLLSLEIVFMDRSTEKDTTHRAYTNTVATTGSFQKMDTNHHRKQTHENTASGCDMRGPGSPSGGSTFSRVTATVIRDALNQSLNGLVPNGPCVKDVLGDRLLGLRRWQVFDYGNFQGTATFVI